MTSLLCELRPFSLFPSLRKGKGNRAGHQVELLLLEGPGLLRDDENGVGEPRPRQECPFLRRQRSYRSFSDHHARRTRRKPKRSPNDLLGAMDSIFTKQQHVWCMQLREVFAGRNVTTRARKAPEGWTEVDRFNVQKDRAARAMAVGKDISKAAREAGVSRTTLYKWLSQSEFQELLRTATDMARWEYAQGAVQGIRRTVALIHHPRARVALRAIDIVTREAFREGPHGAR